MTLIHVIIKVLSFIFG